MPLNIIENISDCPISGLKRKAKHLGFTQDDESFSVTHKIQIHYFNADGTPVTGTVRYNPYTVTLTADNDTKVNPETGAILDPGDEGYENGMGQESFFIMVNDAGAPVRGLLVSSIQTGDARKKFDI